MRPSLTLSPELPTISDTDSLVDNELGLGGSNVRICYLKLWRSRKPGR